MHSANKAIILFDGVCNLCNGFVQFVIRNDRRGYFQFAALQSETGQELLREVNFTDFATDSVVLIHDDKYFTRSAAVLKIFRRLDGFWPLVFAGIILPAFLRDFIYKTVAKNRYRFGKRESCMLPTPELKLRFL